MSVNLLIEEDLRINGEGSSEEPQQQHELLQLICQDVIYSNLLDLMIQWFMHFQL